MGKQIFINNYFTSQHFSTLTAPPIRVNIVLRSTVLENRLNFKKNLPAGLSLVSRGKTDNASVQADLNMVTSKKNFVSLGNGAFIFAKTVDLNIIKMLFHTLSIKSDLDVLMLYANIGNFFINLKRMEIIQKLENYGDLFIRLLGLQKCFLQNACLLEIMVILRLIVTILQFLLVKQVILTILKLR